MLYSAAKLSHLTAELFALKDESREPMISYVRLDLSGQLSETGLLEWQAATKKLLQRFPILSKEFILSEKNYDWKNSKFSLDELNQRIWKWNALSDQDFQNKYFSVEQAPLLHLKKTDQGLLMAVHHVLIDGGSLFNITAFLFSSVLKQNQSWQLAEIKEEHFPPGLFLFAVKESLKRFCLSLFSPPVFMGQSTERFSSAGHIFVARSLALEKVKKTSGTTMNDLILVAYHQALGKMVAEKNLSLQRISILTAINLRQWHKSPEELCNWSSNVACESFSFERKKTLKQFLQIIHQRMNAQKSKVAAFSMLKTLEWADRAGLLLKGRKHRLRYRTPTRIQNGKVKTKGSTFLDTAILSNVGPLPKDFPGYQFIRHFYCVPPVLPPTSVAIGVTAVGAELNFYLRASDCHFDQKKAEILLDILLKTLTEFT